MRTSWRYSPLGWSVLAILGLGLVSTNVVATDTNSESTIKTRFLGVRGAGGKATKRDSWQIVLRNPIKITGTAPSPAVKIWNLDLDDNDVSTFRALKKSGKKVICYFSAGSYENWRDDKGDFLPSDLGETMDGWPDERWIDTRSPNVRKIMKRRIALAASKGCDAIDPDNVDGFTNDTGFDLTEADAIDYIKFLATAGASYGMATSLKNCGDIVGRVLKYVQFAVVEQCVQYSECSLYAPFIKAGKPVFHIEYPRGAGSQVPASTSKKLCGTTGSAAGSRGFSKILKKLNLDGWVQYCGSSKTYKTQVQ
ncbi:glycoside hydrolase superfamily [Thelonectria olida]|uniref:alpha-galactosidase n=1 Tax=Thelonectria olida TaxID=1576542 RepID=A0A9P8W0K7_9HYPO|nr:glycoside hydrolase superfamily [Thelonectria olida]